MLWKWQGSSKSGGESTDSGSQVNTLTSKGEGGQLEPESPISKKASSSDHQQAFDQKHLQFQQQQQFQAQDMAISDSSRGGAGGVGASQSQSAAKPSQEKVL